MHTRMRRAPQGLVGLVEVLQFRPHSQIDRQPLCYVGRQEPCVHGATMCAPSSRLSKEVGRVSYMHWPPARLDLMEFTNGYNYLYYASLTPHRIAICTISSLYGTPPTATTLEVRWGLAIDRPIDKPPATQAYCRSASSQVALIAPPAAAVSALL
jgi:hypothetical protein